MEAARKVADVEQAYEQVDDMKKQLDDVRRQLRASEEREGAATSAASALRRELLALRSSVEEETERTSREKSATHKAVGASAAVRLLNSLAPLASRAAV